MTIKRQWLIALIFTAVLTVVVNSVILSMLINKYFIDYTTENYNRHISQLTEFSKRALIQNNYSSQQLQMQLESYLSDPINRIRLYDSKGNLLADADDGNGYRGGMMGKGMMRGMMNKFSEDVVALNISDNGRKLGIVNITRYSFIGNSFESRRFRTALIGSSFFSFGTVLVLVIILSALISRRMSEDLRKTAQQAMDIDLGGNNHFKKSQVREIMIIQQSLETLKARLKLKQKSRKKLVDELVHQTRTPLTILKTHLEGIGDGVIDMTPDEIRTCETQIENITSIITNMSNMIDADGDIDELKIYTADINYLVKQIIGGLKVQFDKKGIELHTISHQKIQLKTDQYKLSQCIYNILTNAYKYTDSGGKVTVDYKDDGEYVLISVEDTGKGISSEDKDRIFDAYYRGRNSSSSDGEGIGLYVVKENMLRIGGTIDVESEAGKGSKFIMRVPKVTEG